jgi:hypothetical protein
MTRWMKLLTAVGALAALPALGADTDAQSKDRARENAIHDRMNAREHKKATGLGAKTKKGADQAADAGRAAGSRVARTYHGVVHGTKKGIHSGAKKTSDATK